MQMLCWTQAKEWGNRKPRRSSWSSNQQVREGEYWFVCWVWSAWTLASYNHSLFHVFCPNQLNNLLARRKSFTVLKNLEESKEAKLQEEMKMASLFVELTNCTFAFSLTHSFHVLCPNLFRLSNSRRWFKRRARGRKPRGKPNLKRRKCVLRFLQLFSPLQRNRWSSWTKFSEISARQEVRSFPSAWTYHYFKGQ